MTENKPLALPLPYKEKIIYTLAMNVRELIINASEGTIAPEDILNEADYILQALQQVHFSPTSPEPLPKEEKEVGGPEALMLLASLLSDGWIAQDESGVWFFYPIKPEIYPSTNRWDNGNNDWYSLSQFKLPKFSDWKESLYQIKKGKLIECQNVKSK